MKLPNVEDIYPLSPMQEGMLFHTLYNPDSGAYFIQMGCRLQGILNRSAFRAAWEEVVRRHAILRSGFLWDGLKKPLQVVRKNVELPWHEEDWREFSETTQKAKWETFLLQDRKQGFDFQHPPLLRVALIRTGEKSWYFSWSFHHILLDGWCRQIVIQEVFRLYEAYSQKREQKLGSPRPYREYIAWLQERDERKAEAFWREELSGFTETTLLGIEKVKPGIAEDNGDHEVVACHLGPALTQRLEQLARAQQVTLNTVMQGAWGILLSRYSGTKDVVFGATVSGRQAQVPGIETMMGIFINTLPVRVQVSNDETVGDYLRKLQTHMAATREFEYCPLVKVQGWSELLPGVPLFESFVVFENYPVDAVTQTRVSANMTFEDMQTFETNTFPLVLAVIPGNAIMLSSSFSRRIFTRESVERLLEHVEAMLDAMTDGGKRIGDLTFLRPSEGQQILLDWNQTERDYPALCVHQIFENQVEKTPDIPAVVFDEKQLTYRELNWKANQLAHDLVGLGVGPEVKVGICVERGLSFLVGVLGILKAGGAYLPLDPSFPVELLQTMLTDAHVSVVLTQDSTHEGIVSATEFWMQTVNLDDWESIADQSPNNLVTNLTPDNLAYVMYTSGSTGTPKGISIVHEAIVRLVLNTNYVQLDQNDRIVQIASTSFDAATFEVWGALLNGACVVVLDRETSLNPIKLEQAIRTRQISAMFLTTALFNQMARESTSAFQTLRYLLFGGELVDPQSVEAVFSARKQPKEFLHVYGPTEMTTFTTYHQIAEMRQGTIPIGAPISNTTVFVLEEEMEPVPVGVTGELYAGGPGLAREYLNRPDLTAEKFVPNPFARKPGERLYRTGDRVRWNPDGQIEFIGRRDNQVKLRGFRIELGDVEAALRKMAAVEDAAVLMREDRPGDKQLVGYVAASSPLTPGELKDALRSRVPEYMVPSDIVIMDSLPLTRNGKVDRRALPAPSDKQNASDIDRLAPATPVEDLIVPIWEEVLGASPIGVTDNFFAIGGHSLLATQVVVRMTKVLKVDVPLRLVFEYPTIRELASQIERLMQGMERENAPSIERVPRKEYMPLSYAQQRLWFIEQLEPAGSTYNVPASVRVHGTLDVAALERAFDELVRRHEPLRTRFVLVQGEPQQVIEPVSEFKLQTVDLSASSAAEREDQAKSLAGEAAGRPFDLGCGPMMRVTLLRLAAEDHVLLLTMHHIICDGWSLGLMIREVSALYATFSVGEPSPLAELPVQYVDYAIWQRQWLHGPVMDQQLHYWRKQLAGIESLDLPTDRPRPAVLTGNGQRMKIELPLELVAKIKALGRSRGATLYMTLLTAFEVLLYQYTSQKNFAVGSPIAGRRRVETEGLIGFFVNTLVLRSGLSEEMSFSQLLQAVREITLEAYAHQDVPFEKLVEELEAGRDLSRTPLFQAVFVLQNAPLSEAKLGPCTLLPFSAVEVSTAKFDLTLDVWDLGPEVRGALEYNTDLFDAQRISRMLAHYASILKAMVAEPERLISEFSMLAEEERQQLLAAWNQTQSSYPRGKCVQELFEEQVSRTPNAVAVEYEARWLTYRELDQRANRLANYLRTLGVAPEVRVGISMERSLEVVISLVAILKAGGGYVPLDPSYPEQRLRYMATDSNLDIVLVQEASSPAFAETNARVIALSSKWTEISSYSDVPPVSLTTPDNLAYVIYTSGSTGLPKAVGVSHTGVVRLVCDSNFADLPGTRKFLQFAPIAFDASVLEIWGCLLNGGTLTVFTAGNAELEDLADFIECRNVDTAWLTSGLFHQILEISGEKLRGLRQLLVGGDVVSPIWARRALQSLPRLILTNGYGPTENSTFTSCHRMEKVEDVGPAAVPIGKPISATQVYVLNENMGLVPIGVPGELYTGGDGLARGYLNSPELTAEKFVPNPFSQQLGARLYRTGDLVRWASNGTLELIKRLDHQVKIRGHRIELGDIEAALGQLEGVEQAVVITRDSQFGEKQLVAYVVMPGEKSGNDLRRELKEQLPDYMVPAHFLKLDRLPLTPNGKIDRRALPSPETEWMSRSDYVAPETPMEKELAKMWSELLGLEQVSIHDNFFEIGGHSLLGVRLRSMIYDRFQWDLPLRDLFQAPTIASLAGLLERPSNQPSSQILVEIQPKGHRTPFFAVHPGGGSVLCYADLSRELGLDQPFYGLQSPGPSLFPEGAPTFEEMAERYIQAIRSLQPSGPYVLGGWSLGGLLAWEIACQLTAAGETIGLLALMDSYPIIRTTGDDAPESLKVLTWFAWDMALLLGKDPEEMRDKFEQLGPEEQWTHVQNALVQHGVVPEENARAEMARLVDIFTRNLRAMERYTLRPTEQQVLLLAAAESPAPEQLAGEWKRWAGGGVEFHKVPGDHYSMITRPHVAAIAEVLQRRLDDLAECTAPVSTGNGPQVPHMLAARLAPAT